MKTTQKHYLTAGAYDFAFSPRHTNEGIVNHAANDNRYDGFAVRFFIP